MAPDFSEAGHRPLEGVAVQVRHRRRHDRVTLVPLLHRGADLDGGDRAVVYRHPDVGFPTLRGQRSLGVKDRHQSPPLVPISC